MRHEWREMPTFAKLLCIAVAVNLLLTFYDTAFLYDLNQFLHLVR